MEDVPGRPHREEIDAREDGAGTGPSDDEPLAEPAKAVAAT